MPNVPERRKLTAAVKALLEDATGKPVEVATAPRKIDGEQADLPYIVIFPVDGGTFMGPEWCGPNADAAFEYQINSYGMRYDQTEWLSDLVRVTLVDRTDGGDLVNKLTFDGHSVMDQVTLGPPGKLDEVGQIWSMQESYLITVTSKV